jgi:hypothetical protein
VLQTARSGPQIKRQSVQALSRAKIQRTAAEPAHVSDTLPASVSERGASRSPKAAAGNRRRTSPAKPSLLKFSMPASPAALPARQRLHEHAVR